MHAGFQHPDTGKDCRATWSKRTKLLLVTNEDGEEEFKKRNVETWEEATAQLRTGLGVPRDEIMWDED